MRSGYPFASYGYPEIEAEDALHCSRCDVWLDARFWGRADVRFMRRDESYWYESGVICPNCKTFLNVDALVAHSREMSGRLDES